VIADPPVAPAVKAIVILLSPAVTEFSVGAFGVVRVWALTV